MRNSAWFAITALLALTIYPIAGVDPVIEVAVILVLGFFNLILAIEKNHKNTK